jgi:hypothetical protein
MTVSGKEGNETVMIFVTVPEFAWMISRKPPSQESERGLGVHVSGTPKIRK